MVLDAMALDGNLRTAFHNKEQLVSFFTANETIRVLGLPQWIDMAADQNPQWGVDLPMIQRGFVWKPRQIIDLWDSLLSGMPIGALMVSEWTGPSVPLFSTNTSTQPSSGPGQRLSLVDGQQRTLAMCMGWVAFVPGQSNHRLWVDLADEPPPGYQVRLRVTTRNQPFGFRRDDPNSKLSLERRRRAREACDKSLAPDDLLKHASPHPDGAKQSAPLELGALIQEWRVQYGDVAAPPDAAAAWQDWVRQKMTTAPTIVLEDGRAVLKPQWDSFPDEVRQQIESRLAALTIGLHKLFATQIPLVRVDPALFQTDSEEGAEPPLARLFQRVGTNATPLSDADYIYAVLKHQMPEIHGMVDALQRQRTMASLLTAPDLVMTALRLAAVNWQGSDGKPVPDNPNPNKEEFHCLVMRPTGFGDKNKQQEAAKQRQAEIIALLAGESEASLGRLFDLLEANLRYTGGDDIGLPLLMLPYLSRPLLQVLLRLAQKGWLPCPVEFGYRRQALRLVLWWQGWVWNQAKASRIAFKVIGGKNSLNIDFHVAQAVFEGNAGWAMKSPEAISGLGLDDSTRNEDTPTLKGWKRFARRDDGFDRIRGFYSWWWQPRQHYHHPMLLWLQRRYVESLEKEAVAGAIDDTPYDFDHILARAHWGEYWNYIEKTGDVEEFRYARDLIGNSIGNVRVWDASRNRSDGDISPRKKLQTQGQKSLADLEDSAIDQTQYDLWCDCSPKDEDPPTAWSRKRALAFQKVVEQRSFVLYQQLYDQAQFHVWERDENKSIE